MSEKPGRNHRRTPGGSKEERIPLAEAARNLGLTTRAVAQWGNRAGAPVAQDGGRRVYLWPAFPRWRDAELQARAVRLVPAGGFRDAQTRLVVAQAGRAEDRVARARAALVTVEDGDRSQATILERIRGRFAAWPAKMAPRLVGVETAPEVRGILEAGVVEELTAISGNPGHGKERWAR